MKKLLLASSFLVGLVFLMPLQAEARSLTVAILNDGDKDFWKKVHAATAYVHYTSWERKKDGKRVKVTHGPLLDLKLNPKGEPLDMAWVKFEVGDLITIHKIEITVHYTQKYQSCRVPFTFTPIQELDNTLKGGDGYRTGYAVPLSDFKTRGCPRAGG